LSIRKDIIVEAQKEMLESVSNIDVKQLRILYSEVESNLGKMTKTFEDLVNYHNKMIVEKVNFITKDLPKLEEQIQIEQTKLKEKLKVEKILTEKISKSDSFEELEKLIASLNEKHRKKGEYESIISQIDEVSDNITKLDEDLNKIDEILYSEEFEEKLKAQLSKFNKHFSDISYEIYDE